MSDLSARAEQMGQTDKWSLDPPAVSSELQQQNNAEQIPRWLFKNSPTAEAGNYKIVFAALPSS